MTNIRELTLKIKSDVKGLKDISAAGKKTSSELQKQNRVEDSIRKGGRLRSMLKDSNHKMFTVGGRGGAKRNYFISSTTEAI